MNFADFTVSLQNIKIITMKMNMQTASHVAINYASDQQNLFSVKSRF